MKQCWNADPSKRPDIDTLYDEIEKMWKNSYDKNYTNESNILEYNQNFQTNSKLISSTVHSLSKRICGISLTDIFMRPPILKPVLVVSNTMA
ncbi:unnamed protein product [Rhizophagus irregularis]|uniref:Serine-threonine/tyrosine-protein kinase catalytic domain-containing protein n=1 Tax=Rhizophagus irregularis TaxID=588596 RepID=A0A2I1H1G7_9GLOM|nr:hypothetical protein RhiirA4_470475 [Rhizophagus irregularis]CAB4444649.1 unnamed protein product [Rhizophagus irregularis]